MLCENCKKNEATVFYEENINGKKKSYRLCAECAAKKGVSIPDFSREMLNFGVGMFEGLMNAVLPRMNSALKQMSESQKRCPVCGSTLADITKNGRLGCGECYTVFGGMPLPKPKKHGDVSEAAADGDAELEARLKEAIAAENYEEAARIRDILRARGKKGREE